MDKQVTAILTSCGRFDLLERALQSFFIHNTYDIERFIIYDDSTQPIPQDLALAYPFIEWHSQAEKVGQIAALDFLWQQVETEYAFCMEDDWETIAPEFIEASMKVLEVEPKVLQCWLTPLEPWNTHPISWGHITANINTGAMVHYGILTNSGGVWSGTRFNPALKRKADYDLIAPFSQHTTWDPLKPWKCEADISKEYYKHGFRGAMLNKQYIRHIGENRRVQP